jgi:hypothetical protein
LGGGGQHLSPWTFWRKSKKEEITNINIKNYYLKDEFHYFEHSGGSGGHFSDKKEKLAEVGSCSSSSGDGHHCKSKHALVVHVVLLTSHQLFTHLHQLQQ